MLVHAYATLSGKAKWSGPHQRRWEENEFTFHSVTCYTKSMVSRIHVNTTKLHNITCTLVATSVILRRLECIYTHYASDSLFHIFKREASATTFGVRRPATYGWVYTYSSKFIHIHPTLMILSTFVSFREYFVNNKHGTIVVKLWFEIAKSTMHRNHYTSYRQLRNSYVWFKFCGCIELRATSHTSQESWPWHCEDPKESVQRPSQHTSKII